jgi:hypothetical protein
MKSPVANSPAVSMPFGMRFLEEMKPVDEGRVFGAQTVSTTYTTGCNCDNERKGIVYAD